MVTVARIVEKLIEQRPFIQEVLCRGLINNAALAEELLSEVEKELKQKVTFSAVNMAIRRFGETLQKTTLMQAHFEETSGITVQSQLTEIILFKIENVQDHLKQLYTVVDVKKGDFLTITQGLYEVMIITNAKHEKNIISLCPRRMIKKIIRELSSVTIGISPEATETMGLFYLATRALNWANVNIVDIVSTFTEMTFIVRESDTTHAYEAITNMLHTHAKQ